MLASIGNKANDVELSIQQDTIIKKYIPSFIVGGEKEWLKQAHSCNTNLTNSETGHGDVINTLCSLIEHTGKAKCLS